MIRLNEVAEVVASARYQTTVLKLSLSVMVKDHCQKGNLKVSVIIRILRRVKVRVRQSIARVCMC